jgi:hypothetical protein
MQAPGSVRVGTAEQVDAAQAQRWRQQGRSLEWIAAELTRRRVPTKGASAGIPAPCVICLAARSIRGWWRGWTSS